MSKFLTKQPRMVVFQQFFFFLPLDSLLKTWLRMKTTILKMNPGWYERLFLRKKLKVFKLKYDFDTTHRLR